MPIPVPPYENLAVRRLWRRRGNLRLGVLRRLLFTILRGAVRLAVRLSLTAIKRAHGERRTHADSGSAI